MKNIILLFISLVFIVISVSAQDCDKELLIETPGTWKEGMKGSASVTGVTAADLAKEKIIVAQLRAMIKSKYTPMGLEALDGGGYGRSYPNEPANRYQYDIKFLPYFCEGNIIKTAHETSTNFQIIANDFDAEIYDTIGPNAHFSGKGFHEMADMPVEKDGYWYFKEIDVNLGMWMSGKSTVWLITYDGKLPYAYVSKQSFLEKQKRYLLKGLAETLTSLKETLKSNEEEKARKELEYKNDSKKLEYYIRMDYEYIKANTEKYIIDTEKNFENALDKIETQLKLPPEELNQPSIVKEDPNDHLSYLFTTDDDPSGRVLIQPNPGYFNKKLARSSPQFFTVRINGDHQYNITGKAMADVMKAVDFTELKSMLGKEPENTIPQKKNTAPSTPVANTAQGNKQTGFNIYKNEPTPGFKTTPVSEIKTIGFHQKVTDKKIIVKALSIQLNNVTLPYYLNQLLVDIEKNLTQQQQKNTQLLYAKLKDNPVDLADVGVMLYYKGAVNEALWCLAKAAALKPESNYILSNFTGILNLSDAAARSLPLLRYLKDNLPNNSTVLNNLGQALFEMGEINSSKAMLDSCIRIFAYHPQANATRAVIADKEGKNGEAVRFIEKSLKGAYNTSIDDYAGRKGIRLDYNNILNRYRPTDAEYINAKDFMPPIQCQNVNDAAISEAEWDQWNDAMKKISSKINAGLEAAAANYQKETQQALNNKNTSTIWSKGPMHNKAEKLYKVYMDQVTTLQIEMQAFFEKNYTNNKKEIEEKRSVMLQQINKKYSVLSGEGKGDFSQQRCREINLANNEYLISMAGLNTAFNTRFGESIRLSRIETMYWSQLMPIPKSSREMLYYKNAMAAVGPMIAKSVFVQPCDDNSKGTSPAKDAEIPDAYCPISFRFKVSIVKMTGDCSKLEIELEAADLVLSFERDFSKRSSTLAFGVGMSLDLKNDIVPVLVGEIVEFGGAGVGIKGQGFIEWSDGSISDLGLRGDAGIDGVFTDKGDIKIIAKMGVNSGVDISPSPAVISIGKVITEELIATTEEIMNSQPGKQ
jgi:hypothetical protein